jgi:hypothetical protein
MTNHVHLKLEDAVARALVSPSGAILSEVPACDVCQAAQRQAHADVAPLVEPLRELKRDFEKGEPALEAWEGVLLRRKIREAVAREVAPRPPLRDLVLSVFGSKAWMAPGRFAAGVLAFAIALGLGLGAWTFVATVPPGTNRNPDPRNSVLPAWTALPVIEEDESFEVIAALTLTSDEIEVLTCGETACDLEAL